MTRDATTASIDPKTTEPAAATRPNAAAPASSPIAGGEGAKLTLWQRVTFGLAHAVLSGMLAVTSLRTLYVLGQWFGTAEWLINFRRGRRFGKAADSVLDEPITTERRRRLTREHFMRTRCDKIFYLVFDRIPREEANQLFSITNRQLVDSAIADGRGVYVALSHHGAHHVAAMLMVTCGYKVAGVRDRSEGALRRYVQDRFDRRFPEFQRMRVIFADAYPREIYRCFQDGFVLGSAMDVSRVRHPNQRAERLTVFGKDQPFVSGPLRVAARCGAAVVQGFIVAHDDFRYELRLERIPLDSEKGGDSDAAIRAALEHDARAIEGFVRQHPSLMTRLGR